MAVSVMTLPFLDKAIHIDDTIYIYEARQILHSPLDPYGFSLNWLGTTTNALQGIGNPPLLSYYLSIFMALLGESEPVLHGSLILFPLLAAYSTYFLADRFTSYPLQATLLLLLGPPFFVGASNIMLDIPALSLVLAATALFIYGTDTRKHIPLIFSGIFLGLAFLTKYWPIINFGFLLLYAFLNHRTRDAILPLGIATLIGSGWIGLNYYVSGSLPPFLSGGWVVKLNIPFLNRITSLLSFTGASLWITGCFLFPKYRATWLFWAIPLFAATGLVLGQDIRLPGASKALLYLFVLNGVFLLSFIIAGIFNQNILNDREDQFLLIWFLGSMAFVILFIPYNAMRHILIFIFPMILILFRSLTPTPRFKPALYINLALATCLSLGISIGDYVYSDAYRKAPALIFKKIDSLQKDSDEKNDSLGNDVKKSSLWIISHWGFQYYMEKRDARMLGIDNLDQIKKGDWLVDTREAHKNFIPAEIKSRFQFIEELHISHGWPVRLMSRSQGAGWYAQMWGPLPFALDFNGELETFNIYEINHPAETLIPQ